MIGKSIKELRIGIAGVGMVGGALKKYFENRDRKVGEDLLLFDPGRELGSLEELNRAEVVFICVPTPFVKGKGFDLSYVEKACENLTGEKIVILKSTMVPGTTEKLQKKYPQHKILFNPEFLTEVTAEQDMDYPDRQIVGYTEQSHNVAGDVMQLLPLAPFESIIPATEAEVVKYFGNTWFSVKVIFANELYNLCEKLGIDYNRVMDAAAADKRIGRSHLQVMHKGYRGYGGKCLVGDEIVYEVTDKGVKVVPVKDFTGKHLLSMKDGKLIIDEVLAKSQREIKKTIKFHFSKGRTLETSPDHLVVVFDKEKGMIEKEAKNITLNDKIPVAMGSVPFLEQNMTVDFFRGFGRKDDVFVEQMDSAMAGALKPYLTFHQYKDFKRARDLSVRAQAVAEAGISLTGLRIKTGKTGTWVPSSIELDKDFARLIGYYIAEGCCSDNRIHFSFGCHEKELIEDIKQILNKLNIQFSKSIGYWKGKESSTTFKVSSRILSHYFKDFGKNCYEKAIPSYIFSASQEIKDQLLSGLFRGDGSIERSNMGNYHTISYATVSRNLIEGVDLLLREKGILASRKVSMNKKSKVPCYSVLISENKAVRKMLPLLAKQKQQNVNISQRDIKSPDYENIGRHTTLLNIKKIETIDEQKTVYALETKSSHYLTSGGVLTHNCLPKDIRALIEFADKQGIDLKLHKIAEQINNELMDAQNIEDPEKFSARD